MGYICTRKQESHDYIHLCLSRLTCRLICKALTYLIPLRDGRNVCTKWQNLFSSRRHREENADVKEQGGSCARGRETRKKIACIWGGGKEREGDHEKAGYDQGTIKALYFTNIRLTKHALLRIKIADISNKHIII